MFGFAASTVCSLPYSVVMPYPYCLLKSSSLMPAWPDERGPLGLRVDGDVVEALRLHAVADDVLGLALALRGSRPARGRAAPRPGPGRRCSRIHPRRTRRGAPARCRRRRRRPVDDEVRVVHGALVLPTVSVAGAEGEAPVSGVVLPVVRPGLDPVRSDVGLPVEPVPPESPEPLLAPVPTITRSPAASGSGRDDGDQPLGREARGDGDEVGRAVVGLHLDARACRRPPPTARRPARPGRRSRCCRR